MLNAHMHVTWAEVLAFASLGHQYKKEETILVSRQVLLDFHIRYCQVPRTFYYF